MLPGDIERRTLMLDVIVGRSIEDMGGLWKPLLRESAERAALGLRGAVPAVVEAYGGAAAEQAMVWYEDVRPAGVAAYQSRTFTPDSVRQVEGLVTWAATPIFTGDLGLAWARLSGLIQKSVTDFDRVTVEGNAEDDPDRKSVV